ncbi:hypothetical protein ATCV1_z046R [Acanthocystis turfacea chlorella virus 1]|uniref:Uncharacterized protein z046R n=1 Tax=Chlorovirus heliozoae TaxID=322019 RepID=A7K806_9PHYC|nr:hypothetical protein ATCV1_z046R [Acanthocystis turfacea chlorella virus 1]ABT16180.1 hypothetical protein ATCV1_z046R [Acanthocystis turfacea chlorella virus 1]
MHCLIRALFSSLRDSPRSVILRLRTASVMSSSTSRRIFLHSSMISFLMTHRKKLSCPTVVMNFFPF